MSEVGASYRSRLLRSKRDEASRIVTSRKRKLREFFAVCDNDGPVPQISHSHPDAPPTTPAEAQFLDACDILQDRSFNESKLPTRRQLRSDTLKQKPPSRRVSPEPSVTDVPQNKLEVQLDGLNSRKSQGTSPVVSDGGANAERNGADGRIDGEVKDTPVPGPPSKSSQADLPAEASVVLNEIVEETFQNAARSSVTVPDSALPAKDLESNRIRTVLESRPGSPGVDPRKTVPSSTEDAANLPEATIFRANKEHHKAATAHLPPKEIQEARIEEAEKLRTDKEDRDGHIPTNPLRIPVDLASSPSSTLGAHSAATPALHEASTETSPENNNSRYDELDRLEKDNDARTPLESKQSSEDIARKEEQDRILKAQADISRAEVPDNSHAAADAQLRMEDQAASTSQASADAEIADSEAASSQDVEKPIPLANEVSTSVKQTVETRNGDVPMSNTAPLSDIPRAVPKEIEVPDSEGDEQTPVDAMDVDTATVKDSFESQTTADSGDNTSADASAPSGEDLTKQQITESKTPSSRSPTSTPRRTPSAAPPLERMTTRVASGAIRHKSVSEILGETAVPNMSPTSARSPVGKPDSASNSPSRASTPQSPRSFIQKAREKERSRLSTVVFAKKPTGSTSGDATSTPRGGNVPQAKPDDDYFMTLYINGYYSPRTGNQSTDSLLQTAHKTVTTSNAYIPFIENQTTRILKRIYGLQSAHKWSLRQPKRSEEPVRPTTHWDVLLQEAKWMRTDFREERKWKMAVARNLAFACAEWFEASPEERKILQVNATPPPIPASTSSKDIEMSDAMPHATPELVASGDADSPMDDVDEELRLTIRHTVSPTAIFGLHDDDVVFGLSRSPASDKLLEELPMYGAPLKIPRFDLATSDIDPDRFWKRPAVAVSKYIEGRMELKFDKPVHKKSRFEYEEDSEDEEPIAGQSSSRRAHLPPEQTDIGLFDPANKHIRDRIHAGHQFRPPSEFNMPLQTFFENRHSSQWTCSEDDELKKLVREYSYNWSLISNILTSPSLYSSGAERRTPWECFERWIQLEGLPADMQKTAYFKAYNNRMEAAQRNLTLLATQAPQQANANGQMMMQPRRRTTATQRVEKRRNQKHLTLVDAMRKLSKKRENAHQKQLLSAQQAAARKPNEQPQGWGAPIKTPQAFSQLKHEREEAMKERLALFQQRQEQQRREMQARARNANQPQALPNGLPQQRVAPLPNGLAPPNGQPNGNGHLAVPGQNRPRPLPPQMGAAGSMPNNLRIPQAMTNGVPQAQMQGGLPPNPPMTADLAENARRVSLQQRQQILQRQQQQGSPHPGQAQNSPPRMNGMPSQLGFMPNNIIAAYNNANNNMSTPSGISVSSPAQAGSPRIGLPVPGMPNGGLPPSIPYQEIERNVRNSNPNASANEIHKLIGENIAAFTNNKNMQQRGLVQPPSGIAQSAMNAAAGSNNLGVNGPIGQRPPQGIENSNPQMYAQMLSNHHQQRLQNSQQQAQQFLNGGGQNQGQGNGTGAQQNGGN